MALAILLKELSERYGTIFVDVVHVDDGLDDHVFLCFGDFSGRDVLETVGAADVYGGPETGAVVVVEIEECGCVKTGDVMLLCYLR